MKKILLTILLGALGGMAIVSSAFAVTNVSFNPINVSVRQGQTFTLTIGVNPQGVKNYTAKTELRYPADLLEAKSFTFASGWMPLAQAGYDLTDNVNGVLIKTAGYPGGLLSPATFGTVSFLAKKSGNGAIALNSNSFAFDTNSQNVLGGVLARTTVSVASALPVPARPTPSIIPTPPPAGGPTLTPAPEPSVTQPIVSLGEETPVVPSSPIATRSLSASIGSIVSLGTDSVIVGILVVLIILYALYALVRRTRRKKLGKLG